VAEEAADAWRKTLKYTACEDVKLDEKLVYHDILGNEAHALMLYRCGLLSREDLRAILGALDELLNAWREGKFSLRLEFEDVHMNVEHFVIERAGEGGAKLHTARSRNDQVQLDLRLWMRDCVLALAERLVRFIRLLLDLAEVHVDSLMPAYTHFQPAQPSTLAHWLLAWANAFSRDFERLWALWRWLDLSPLGAGAASGTTLPIDRVYVAELLGFSGVQWNSLDVASSRGELEAELVMVLALLATHMGRLAEDLVLWSNPHFGFVALADEYCTGSSAMPQKRNPDVAELLRARTGRIYGNLIHILTVLKGLPTGYSRDMQETKKALMESVETALHGLDILHDLLSTARFNTAKMRDSLRSGFYTATDLAELLVLRGVPFRQAYGVVKEFLAIIQERKVDGDRWLETLQEVATRRIGRRLNISEKELEETLNPASSVKKRVAGGPSPSWTSKEIEGLRAKVGKWERTLDEKRRRIEAAVVRLNSLVSEVLGRG